MSLDYSKGTGKWIIVGISIGHGHEGQVNGARIKQVIVNFAHCARGAFGLDGILAMLFHDGSSPRNPRKSPPAPTADESTPNSPKADRARRSIAKPQHVAARNIPTQCTRSPIQYAYSDLFER